MNTTSFFPLRSDKRDGLGDLSARLRIRAEKQDYRSVNRLSGWANSNR